MLYFFFIFYQHEKYEVFLQFRYMHSTNYTYSELKREVPWNS